MKLFGSLIKKYSRLKDELSVNELTHSLIDEIQVIRTLKDEGTPEAQNRMENIQEFLAGISEFHVENPEGTLRDFLAEVSLVADVDRWDTKRNSVTLMTVHAAKGLEFPVVFVSGLEEGLFPLSSKEQDELEEERRLFYVAVTRAEKKVYLSYARQRYRFGKISFQVPSRFMSEIQSELLEQEHGFQYSKVNTQKSKVVNGVASEAYRESIFPSLTFSEWFSRGEGQTDPVGVSSDLDRGNADQSSKNEISQRLKVGLIVEHQFFGEGKIIEISGKGDNERVVVLFEANQKKQLMVRYANLRIVKRKS